MSKLFYTCCTVSMLCSLGFIYMDEAFLATFSSVNSVLCFYIAKSYEND